MGTDKYHIQVCHHLNVGKSASKENDRYAEAQMVQIPQKQPRECTFSLNYPNSQIINKNQNYPKSASNPQNSPNIAKYEILNRWKSMSAYHASSHSAWPCALAFTRYHGSRLFLLPLTVRIRRAFLIFIRSTDWLGSTAVEVTIAVLQQSDTGTTTTQTVV